MKRVLVIPNTLKDVDLVTTRSVTDMLLKLGMIPLAEERFYKYLGGSVEYFSNDPISVDLVLVIGGDGSVIEASKIAISLNAPLLGVNLGNLGYLSEVETDNLEILENLRNGHFVVEEKMMLEVNSVKNGIITACDRLAVNDVIVSHSEYLGIADICLKNSIGEVVKYRADAVILATPAGSTAYALSSGGPIISHNLDSITATPVSPHSFFNRSIVYGADEELIISNIGEAPLKVSVDGRYFDSLSKGDSCKIRKSRQRFKMLTFSENNMFTTLFSKLKILSNIE